MVEAFARVTLASEWGSLGGTDADDFFECRCVRSCRPTRLEPCHRGRSSAARGPRNCPFHQRKLGQRRQDRFLHRPVDANPVNQTDSLKDLVADMRAGKVDLLVILGGNPVYDAPSDLDFADVLKSGKIPVRVHLGLYKNETAELCQWHIDQAHELEAWGDARAYDGTASIIQPLIAPLYNGKSAQEFVALLSGQAMRPATIWSALTGRSSTPARISKPSGANRCTMDGSKERLTLQNRSR